MQDLLQSILISIGYLHSQQHLSQIESLIATSALRNTNEVPLATQRRPWSQGRRQNHAYKFNCPEATPS
ncbi:hypothetical protein DBV39_15180 [Orrella marina]|uniref:Uncharacterized protein n=1 Tax=Orrella marina TaxID=2163011 RepID=A0A2R4XM11_9BURK|nr:hypothetical protein DBV39_15180 [Orrella marina]